jgi:transposase
MEACAGTHFIARQMTALGHDVRLIPAQYVKPFLKGHKNDLPRRGSDRGSGAAADHALCVDQDAGADGSAGMVRSRLVRQRTGVANQIRGFLLERGITVRKGLMPLRKALPEILSSKFDVLSPRMINLIGDLVQDWRRLDERIARVSTEIEALAKQDENCQRLMSVPGVGPIVSSAVVAAIGNGTGFKQGRDFAAWLGVIPKQESTGERTILGKISKRGKQIRKDTIRAGRTRRSRAAAKNGKAGFMALDRAGLQAASPEHAGNRARQQACAHRLGRSRPWSRLSAEQHRPCLTKTRSGPPRGCRPPLYATVAHHIGRASDGGSCTSFTRSLEMMVPRGARGVERSETTRAPPRATARTALSFWTEPIRREQPGGSCASKYVWRAPPSDWCPGEAAVTDAQWGDCA